MMLIDHRIIVSFDSCGRADRVNPAARPRALDPDAFYCKS